MCHKSHQFPPFLTEHEHIFKLLFQGELFIFFVMVHIYPRGSGINYIHEKKENLLIQRKSSNNYCLAKSRMETEQCDQLFFVQLIRKFGKAQLLLGIPLRDQTTAAQRQHLKKSWTLISGLNEWSEARSPTTDSCCVHNADIFKRLARCPTQTRYPFSSRAVTLVHAHN